MRAFDYAAPSAFAGEHVHVRLHDTMSELAADARQNYSTRAIRDARSDWFGNHTLTQVLTYAERGDLSLVAASDALLAKMERYTLETSRLATVNDVVGAFPDVPAFIAGHPMSMRRRVRSAFEDAPLAVIADLSISAGMSAQQIAARGAAILALVRALSGRRAVELWTVCGLDAFGTDASFVGSRIDTAPLDLARAAYALTSASFPRRIIYGIAGKVHDFTGKWPFRGRALSPENMAACLAPAFTHIGETLCIPGAHIADPLTTNPEAWLEARLKERGAIALDDAA